MKSKKFIRFFVLAVIAILSAFCVIGCGDNPEPKPDPTVTIDRASATVDVYETITLTATKQNTDEEIVWTSSDESIATVSGGGRVTGVAAGSVTITASAGGASASCSVTVRNSYAAPVLKVDHDSVSVAKDGTFTLQVETIWKGEPIDETVAYTYAVADDKPTDLIELTSVTGGVAIKGLEYGETVFTISAHVRGVDLVKNIAVKVCNLDITFGLGDGFTDRGDAYVSSVALVATETDKAEIDPEIKVYDKGELVDGATVTYTVEDESIAKVENGKIVGVAEGQTYVTAGYDHSDVKLLINVYRPVITLNQTVTLESSNTRKGAGNVPLNKTITLNTTVAGTISKLRLTADGENAVKSVDETGIITIDPTKYPTDVSDLGEGKTIYVDTDKAVYKLKANLYTMIINSPSYLYMLGDEAYAADPAKNYWGGYFVLSADLDMSTRGSSLMQNKGEYPGRFYYSALCSTVNWTTLEQYGDFIWRDGNTGGFRGVIDGKGHTIKNINIVGGEKTGVEGKKRDRIANSLIGQMATGGVVKNISFTNVTLGPSSALISPAGTGTIENIYAEISSYTPGNPPDANNYDRTGVFYSQLGQSGAVVKNCVAVFTNGATAHDGFVGLGTFDMNQGVLDNVYGVGIDDSIVVRKHSVSGTATDKYGAFATLDAFAGANVDLSKWSTDFWATSGVIPYPNGLASTFVKTPDVTVPAAAAKGTDVTIENVGKYERIKLSASAIENGVTLDGNVIKVPADIESGATIGFTVYNVFSPETCQNLTILVQVSEAFELECTTEAEVDGNETFVIDLGDEKSRINGTLALATIDDKSFSTRTYDASTGKATLDTATLASLDTLDGTKTVTLTFHETSGDAVSKIITVTAKINAATMFIRDEADLNAFLGKAKTTYGAGDIAYDEVKVSWMGTYKLAGDITCDGTYDSSLEESSYWSKRYQSTIQSTEIGKAYGFGGVLDGQGYTIYNFSANGRYSGITPVLSARGVIKNLAFVNAQCGNGGILTSLLAGTVENVYVQVGTTKDNSDSGAAWGFGSAIIGNDVFDGAHINKVLVEYVTPLPETAKTGYPVYTVFNNHGALGGLYAVGASRVNFKYSSDTPGDKTDACGAYDSYAALKTAVDFASWSNGFWKVVNGLPVPSRFVVKPVIGNTKTTGLSLGTTIEIECDGAYLDISLDAAAISAGYTLVGKTVTIPSDPSTMAFTVTVTSVLDSSKTTSVTFHAATTETKQVTGTTEIGLEYSDDEHAKTVDLSAFTLGNFTGAKIKDGADLTGVTYDASAKTLKFLGSNFDKTLWGNQTVVATFETVNGGVVERVTNVEIPVLLVTKYVSTLDELKALESTYAVPYADDSNILGNFFSNVLGGYFVQTADINADGAKVQFGYISTTTWKVVNTFGGVYDGRNYCIDKLYAEKFGGLFTGISANGIVKNLVFTNAQVGKGNGADGNSGLISTHCCGAIENIVAHGSASYSYDNTLRLSMIASSAHEGSIIKNCLVILTAHSGWYGDGLCRGGMIAGNRNEGATVTNCLGINLKLTGSDNNYAMPAIGAVDQKTNMLTDTTGDTDTVHTIHGWTGYNDLTEGKKNVSYDNWVASCADVSIYDNNTWHIDSTTKKLVVNNAAANAVISALQG